MRLLVVTIGGTTDVNGALGRSSSSILLPNNVHALLCNPGDDELIECMVSTCATVCWGGISLRAGILVTTGI